MAGLFFQANLLSNGTPTVRIAAMQDNASPQTHTPNSPPLSSYQRQHIERLKTEMTRKYRHLHPRFFTDSICMQAKIDINVNPGQSLLIDPGLYADILQTENFIAEHFEHRLPNRSGRKDGQQYVLTNEEIAHIGHKFVLKATFGPSFISLWFRNESTCDRLETPLCYALEIMNKLHDRINRVSTHNVKKKLVQQHYFTGFERKTPEKLKLPA